jgi:FkbM family methyltransferase
MRPAPTDPPEVENYLWHGWSGNIGWDVGANCGQSIPKMAARFKRVVAFEPADECAPYLDEIMKFKGDTVTWYPYALSDQDGDIVLIDIPDKINTGQLVSYEAEGMEYDARAQGGSERIVEGRTIDSLVGEWDQAPDFLKIDVEGHELKILHGALETLQAYGPGLLIEIHSTQLGEDIGFLLEHLEYDVETVRHPHYIPGSGMEDRYNVHFWYKAKRR